MMIAPEFMDPKYYVRDFGTWKTNGHMKEDAPESMKKDFEDYFNTFLYIPDEDEMDDMGLSEEERKILENPDVWCSWTGEYIIKPGAAKEKAKLEAKYIAENPDPEIHK